MAELKILPVPTRILTDADDIVDAIEYYAGEQVTADDLVCCAESVVAITQGRFVFPEQLHISRAARFACRFIPDYGSLASPHGMQSLMDVEGTGRVLFALFAGFLAKLVGKGSGCCTHLRACGSIRRDGGGCQRSQAFTCGRRIGWIKWGTCR